MFVDGIREELKKILRKAIFFGVGPVLGGWVGRSTANQHFLRSVQNKMKKTSSF